MSPYKSTSEIINSYNVLNMRDCHRCYDNIPFMFKDLSFIESCWYLSTCSYMHLYFLVSDIYDLDLYSCNFSNSISGGKMRLLGRFLDRVIQHPLFYSWFVKAQSGPFLNNEYISEKSKTMLK